MMSRLSLDPEYMRNYKSSGHWVHGGTTLHNRIDDMLYLLRLLTAAKIIRKSQYLSTVMMCHKC